MIDSPHHSIRKKTSLAIEAHDADPMTTELLTPETTRFASTPFQQVIDIWRSRQSGDKPPEWYDFDFSDFKGWHSQMLVSWFPDGEPNPQIRIMGEAWRPIYGGTIAGLRFSQMKPRQYEQQFRDHFGGLRSTGQFGFTSGRATLLDRDFLVMSVLELPVRRNGDWIDGLIHCLQIGGDGHPKATAGISSASATITLTPGSATGSPTTWAPETFARSRR